MTELRLQSQHDSLKLLATFFGQALSGGKTAVLEIREDVCFGTGKWLEVGEIELYPGDQVHGDESKYSAFERALNLGSYEWRLPVFDDLLNRARKIFQGKKEGDLTRSLERALEGVTQAAIRCGFAHPVFDAEALANMPFRNPTTIVVDTTSVLQGALDFVVRFLYPYTRIKIPAVVHMEILNMVDRYLMRRRKKSTTPHTLLDHSNSQGGQRVLLRLELQTDTEIERPRMGSDPLRGIIQPDSDAEDKNLGLQKVQRSFADRLILETAIQHRERMSPDHPVMLMTSDQGLARMTIGEGMQPLFFDKNYSNQLFGTVLTGTCFYPFISSSKVDHRLYSIPLTELLWELAVTYGASRVANNKYSATFEVCAMGEKLSWSPFHAKDDLLWVKWDGFDISKGGVGRKKEAPQARVETPPSLSKGLTEGKIVGKGAKALKGSYKFSLSSMILLIKAFIEKAQLTDEDGIRTIGLKTLDNYEKYRNFLRSGNFIMPRAAAFAKTDQLQTLWEALLRCNYSQVELSLMAVPSFKAFREELENKKIITAESVSSVSGSAFSTYYSLAEVVCIGLHIPEEGSYITLGKPTLDEFSGIAEDCYKKISKGEEYVLTGQWLEAMAKDYGLHPVMSKNRLNEAYQARYLQRYTEGSTPETRFEKHTMSYLNVKNGIPVIENVNLYHGDFILPDRASVRIRINKVDK
jgi:hypothetical protein